MIKVYVSVDKKRAIMVDDEKGIIKAYGLVNVLCCEAESLIETEELEETEERNFEWSEYVLDIQYIKEKYGMSLKQISDRFDIPYRSVQNWNSNQRECPRYILKMMDEILETGMQKHRMFVAAKENGDFIEEVKSLEEGKRLIAEYEKADKKDGTYTEGFYDIVDEDHCTLL